MEAASVVTFPDTDIAWEGAGETGESEEGDFRAKNQDLSVDLIIFHSFYVLDCRLLGRLL